MLGGRARRTAAAAAAAAAAALVWWFPAPCSSLSFLTEGGASEALLRGLQDPRLKEDLKRVALSVSSLSEEASRMNALSRDSVVVREAEVVGLDMEGLDLRAKVERRNLWGKKSTTEEDLRVDYPGGGVGSLNALKSSLMEVYRSAGKDASAIIYSIPVGFYGGLPGGMRLNNVPHSRQVRDFIYRGVADAAMGAVSDPSCDRRMTIRCTVPELNPEMDTYRVGTMLELVRETALSLAETGSNVKLCVQGSMGEGIFTGLPLSLSGTRAIMERMDWPEGYVGEQESPIRFGAVGPEFVEKRDDVIVIIAPQSIVGASIHGPLSTMVDEVMRQGKTIILVNPNLADKPSSAGIMGVRGRAERLDFADSFKDIYNFRLIYPNRAVMYPILGAVMKVSHDAPYAVFGLNADSSNYEVVGAFDADPGPDELSQLKLQIK